MLSALTHRVTPGAARRVLPAAIDAVSEAFKGEQDTLPKKEQSLDYINRTPYKREIHRIHIVDATNRTQATLLSDSFETRRPTDLPKLSISTNTESHLDEETSETSPDELTIFDAINTFASAVTGHFTAVLCASPAQEARTGSTEKTKSERQASLTTLRRSPAFRNLFLQSERYFSTEASTTDKTQEAKKTSGENIQPPEPEAHITSRIELLDAATYSYYEALNLRNRVRGMDIAIDLKVNKDIYPPTLIYATRKKPDGTTCMSSHLRMTGTNGSGQSEYNTLRGFILPPETFPVTSVFQPGKKPDYRILHDMRESGYFKEGIAEVPRHMATAGLFSASKEDRGKVLFEMIRLGFELMAPQNKTVIATTEATDDGMRSLLEAFGFKPCTFWPVHYFPSVTLNEENKTVPSELGGKPAVWMPYYISPETMLKMLRDKDGDFVREIIANIKNTPDDLYNIEQANKIKKG